MKGHKGINLPVIAAAQRDNAPLYRFYLRTSLREITQMRVENAEVVTRERGLPVITNTQTMQHEKERTKKQTQPHVHKRNSIPPLFSRKEEVCARFYVHQRKAIYMPRRGTSLVKRRKALKSESKRS